MAIRKRSRFRMRPSLSSQDILALMSMGKVIDWYMWGVDRRISYCLGKVPVQRSVILNLIDKGFIRGLDFGDYGYMVLRKRLDKPEKGGVAE